MRNGADAVRAPCRRARPLAPRVPPPAPGLGIPGEAGSHPKGGKDGKMKCGKNLSFQSRFVLPLLTVGRRRQGHRTQSLPFRPRGGREPVKRRAKPSSGTASAFPYRQSGSRARRRPPVPSPRAQALPFARGYLPPAHQSQQADDNLRQQTVCPRGSLFAQFPGQELGSNCGSGLPNFSVSLVEKPLKCRTHGRSRALGEEPLEEQQDPDPPRASGHHLQSTTVPRGRDAASPPAGEPGALPGLRGPPHDPACSRSQKPAGSPGAPNTRRALLRHRRDPALYRRKPGKSNGLAWRALPERFHL